MKRHIATIVFLLQLFSLPVFSQVLGGDICLSPVEGKDFVPARPLCGWDSLNTKLKLWFPEIERRAGVRSMYLLDFSIGSDSTIAKFNSTKIKHFNSEYDLVKLDRSGEFYTPFISTLQDILKSTKWTPALFKGHPCNVKLPIFFNLYGFVRKHGVTSNVALPLSVETPFVVYDNKESDY